jgi:hypothetical protein
MSSQSESPALARSPILAAVGISFAIAIGSMLASTDVATVTDALTGRWLTRPLAEAQQRNAAAIAALEKTVGAITRDIDFVAARVGDSIRRGEEQTSDRIAHLNAEIAALKNRITGIQSARLAAHASDALFGVEHLSARLTDASGDVSGLRSSLHDLAAAHSGAVAAIGKRLDRIEVMVGISTDMTSSVANPGARKAELRAAAAKLARKPIAPAVAPRAEIPTERSAHPERGHIFTVKPVSQTAPLRGSKAPG